MRWQENFWNGKLYVSSNHHLLSMARQQPIIVMSENGGRRDGRLIGGVLLIAGVGVGGYFLYDSYTNCKWPFDGSIGIKGNCAPDAGCAPGSAPQCIDGTIRTCGSDGRWVDTGTACSVETIIITSVTVRMKDSVTGLPASGVTVDWGEYGKIVTNTTGEAVFFNIPATNYNVWTTKPNWHNDEYANHVPWGDYVRMDFTNVLSPAARTTREILMFPNTPDSGQSSFTISPSAVAGHSGGCTCTSLVGCNHQNVQGVVTIKNQWGEPIPNFDVTVVPIDGPNGVGNCCLSVQTQSCSPKTPVYGDLLLKTDANGQSRFYIWAHNNNNFVQYFRAVALWDNMTKSLVLGEPGFQFQSCVASVHTCYELNATFDNTWCQ